MVFWEGSRMTLWEVSARLLKDRYSLTLKV